jgi:hypothetical protein
VSVRVWMTNGFLEWLVLERRAAEVADEVFGSAS